MVAPSPRRLSNIAELWLESQRQRYSLAQVAIEFVILRKTVTVPSGPAILVIDIDGLKEKQPVHGLSSDHRLPEYVAISRS